jgi:hypothetical protein
MARALLSADRDAGGRLKGWRIVHFCASCSAFRVWPVPIRQELADLKRVLVRFEPASRRD